MKRKIIKLSAIALPILILIGVLFIWLEFGSYKAGEAAEAALVSNENIKVSENGSLTVFEPESYDVGIIFYPGGRVDHKAYAPLLRELASEGYLCVLVEMPFDLAFLNMNGAEEAQREFPEVGSWIIGGHSLGGAMAASHAAKNPEKYDTLLLLAAYSTENIADSGMRVISVYGENDGVLNLKNYERNKKNLPSDTVELIIEGGNHALFGDYGEQSGDGEAEISAKEQLAAVVALID